MPACVRIPEPGRVWLMAAVLGLAGCSDPAADGRFEIKRLDANWLSEQVRISTEQRLELSEEARDALIHGVPLTLALDLRIRNTSNQIRAAENSVRYEIRYLPLSDHYQLAFSDDTPTRIFPRLRHVLADLSRSSIVVPTGVLPAGEYEVLARLRLDQNTMPPPMRLPVLLSSKWRHDSSWSSWPLLISTAGSSQ
ncbi:MAG: DUF4390 domain-containing protein [Xanthomonadales bacterium]|nr:DUF4390 domain-containing protein [Xanthomonadales bacterium]